MRSPIFTLFDTMARQGVLYCALRDAGRLDDLRRGGELDLLVHPAHLERAARVLRQCGFVALVSRGHAPHHFFVRYEAATDGWIKCDVVTAVAYGRPVHNLATDLADASLAGRQYTGRCFAPCPEDELFMLLLHCVLDKRAFRPDHVARATTLRRQVSREGRLRSHVSRYWPTVTWPGLADAIDREDWESLLARRSELATHLRRQDRLGTAARAVRDRAIRKAQRWIGLVRPGAPAVALLAPDGAGKSTLVAGIAGSFFAPVHAAYMGLHQAGMRRRGPIPGLGLARRLMTQWRRYLTARGYQACGHLVLFDRYTYDALLPASGTPGVLRRSRRWLLARSCPGPDLTVILDAPGDVLFARKGEHSAALLERQRQWYLALRPSLGRSEVVDARCDAGEMRRRVTTLIWEEYRRRERHDGAAAKRPASAGRPSWYRWLQARLEAPR